MASELLSEQRTNAIGYLRYLKKLYFGDTDPTKRGATAQGKSKDEVKDIKVLPFETPSEAFVVSVL